MALSRLVYTDSNWVSSRVNQGESKGVVTSVRFPEVARYVRDVEAVGSNPTSPTTFFKEALYDAA